MEIFIKYGAEKYFSYQAPIIPRVGEVIVYSDIVTGKEFEFELMEVSHYIVDEHYEITLHCDLIKASDEN